MRRTLLILAPIIAIIVACGASARSAKTQAPCQTSCTLHESMAPMPGMDATPGTTEAAGSASMSGMSTMSDMGSMGPHMTLTPTWSPAPGDSDRAAQIVATLRTTLQQYQDYRVAEQDGFVPFHTEIPQAQYHFTNWKNAAAALATFDPTKPTSLLYAKTADGYRL